MLDVTGYDLSGHVFATAREQTPRDAMEFACRTVTGTSGFLVIGNHAVHAPGARLVDPASVDSEVVVQETFQEHALAPFDLTLSRCAARAPTHRTPVFEATVVALRLGLLARILDRAFGHLEHRESFGQKLTHHQLVKAQFSETGAMLSRQREELSLAQDRPVNAQRLHAEIDRHTVQAAKLMGGHGFRAGALNGLEYLSALVRATLAPEVGG
ncbi:hypothetical protein [Thalassococcus sp. S3]|uniref:hypothetical protein n=1 Tax=Thalassococcus sp. S3 TaxID=2017482 RepID=UPI001024273C|nr:hypothetical protein [Thalassococcus sp. S3]QBF29660.1 hypothetical protein CFI11_00320 [Thalassococcus sp. S3]